VETSMPNAHKWEDRKRDPDAPKPRGGGKPRNPNSLANLKSWPKGTSGNPSGKSSSINDVMRLARSHCPEAVERLVEIMRDRSVPPRDTITACMAIMDRGLGRPIVPVFKGSPNGFPSEMVSEIGADGEMTPLLLAAGRGADASYKNALRSELDRIEKEERLAKDARRDQIDKAAAAMRRGEDVDPAMRILASVRNETN
jgi:hypothetical protein